MEAKKWAKRYPIKKCPACCEVAGAFMLHGYPIPEMFELERMGHVVLMGCAPPLAGQPMYNYQCTACGHKW